MHGKPFFPAGKQCTPLVLSLSVIEALSLNLETTEVDEDQSSNKEDDVESAVKFDEDFKKRNILELKKNMNDAIRNEDYESASKIRDKIDKINSDN